MFGIFKFMTYEDQTSEGSVGRTSEGSVGRTSEGSVGRTSEVVAAGHVPSEPFADKLAEKCKVSETKGSLRMLDVPLEEDQGLGISGCKRFVFGPNSRKRTCTVMVVGGTGAGKSTLINSLFNFVAGVEWNSPYRFRLVVEDPAQSQIHSQTSEVVVYQINHQDGLRIDFSLTVIDTPGYGDARGIQRDQETTEQIRRLFIEPSGVSDVHVVCFVAQSSLVRLTPSQKYIFDSLLSIFGKDVAENVRILVTFADGTDPSVLNAIEAAGVPCSKTEDGVAHLQFNNSAMFTAIRSADTGFGKMFWDMGVKNMNKFFEDLAQTDPKSLTLSAEVLKERRHLETLVENLEKQVKIGLQKLDMLKDTQDTLKDKQTEMNRNKDFEITVSYIEPKQINISGFGRYITNCQVCRHTCHFPCHIADDSKKYDCTAMRPDGTCSACPGKCHWAKHFNQKYKWEYEHVTKKQTIDDLKKKFMAASQEKAPVEALMSQLQQEYDKQKERVNEIVKEATEALNRLKKIALKPTSLSTLEYIELLIESEKNEHKPGWNKRVAALEEVKKRTETLLKVEQGEELLS